MAHFPQLSTYLGISNIHWLIFTGLCLKIKYWLSVCPFVKGHTQYVEHLQTVFSCRNKKDSHVNLSRALIFFSLWTTAITSVSDFFFFYRSFLFCFYQFTKSVYLRPNSIWGCCVSYRCWWNPRWQLLFFFADSRSQSLIVHYKHQDVVWKKTRKKINE